MGEDCVRLQTFIPAGRAFFTSIGKAIAAFEQGRVLDSFILRFGRVYTSARDRPSRVFGQNSRNYQRRNSVRLLESAAAKIFGGELKNDGDREFVLTPDGREIPLSALSSGQQELLPLITVLRNLLTLRGPRLVYLEEPEAHLFPQAQSQLVEALAIVLNSPSSQNDIVLTTHSPYVLSKINNLIKAGELSKTLPDSKKRELISIVPAHSWLAAGYVKSYAIINGKLKNILSNDALIDGDYIDSVSNDIGREFDRLLQIEVAE